MIHASDTAKTSPTKLAGFEDRFASGIAKMIPAARVGNVLVELVLDIDEVMGPCDSRVPAAMAKCFA